MARLASFAAILVFCAGLVSGCQSTLSGVESKSPPELSPVAATAIAGDLIPRLAEELGPSKGTILLLHDSSPFGSALETSLRTWGYAVSTEKDAKDTKTIRLAYVVSSMDGQFLARLDVGSVELGRVYSPTATGATPSSPLSIMRRG